LTFPPLIAELRASGARSLRAIAQLLARLPQPLIIRRASAINPPLF
jgi:hypothetical protein